MNIHIIGAGISGLSAAYFLSKNGHKVCLFEGASEVGGLAGYFPINGTFLEKYYHHSFAGHTHLIELLNELSLKKKYFSKSVKTGFYHKGNIYPFVTAKDLIRFRPLSFANRIRLGMTSLAMMKITDWQQLEKHSALTWLRKKSGDDVCKTIWEPLLKMKFGSEYSNISAAWLWNRVVDRKKAGSGKDELGYLQGGYKALIDALIRDIKRNGGEIKIQQHVDKVQIEDDRCTGLTVNNKFIESDVVISTVSTKEFVSISPQLPAHYTEKLDAIKYQGSVCVVLKLKAPLSKYYWINISDDNSPFVGIIEHTNFIPAKEYGNDHIVYLTRYENSDSNLFKTPSSDIFDAFISHLEKQFPSFDRANVLDYWVFRDKYSQPVFVKNYSKIMPEFQTPVNNLFLLNIAQIYPESRSLNSSIKKSKQIARLITNNYGK